mgnify:CR=1 FL=1
MNQNEIIAQKKESSDESSKSSKSDGSDSESSEDDKKVEEIATPKSYKQMNKFVSSSKLEKILEGDEENYSTNKETKESIDDPHELISHLKSKIEELESEISNLKDKNDTLKKDNIKNDTKLRRMSFVGIRKKFTFSTKGGADQVKMAELLREKSDLQEINEKMLNMLTDKEMEIEELEENFEKFKTDMKVEVQKYLEVIDDLEDKIEAMEEANHKKQNTDNSLDEIIEEYNKYKERMDKAIKEHIKKEEELTNELENKDITIQNLKNEIQSLEIDNIQLQNQTEQKEKDYDKEVVNFDLISHENQKLKGELILWQQKLKKNDENMKKELDSKDEEIRAITQDLEFNKNNFNKIKEEKNNEIVQLKDEISRCNRDISNLIKKNDILQKEKDEIVRNNDILQTKFDKKSKELSDINESAKKLIENKDNLIKQYEDEIEEVRKEKNQLIEQNHELLDKLKNSNTNNLADLLHEEEENENEDNNNGNDNYENLLLKAENKALKEQIESQANDLVSLNAMEKEVSRLKMEHEKMQEEYKALKDKFNKQKFQNGADELMENIKRRHHNTVKNNKKQRRFNAGSNKAIPSLDENDELNRQMEAFKKIKEDEKKILVDEIDKLKSDISISKVKFMNQELENETLLIKYKNYLKCIGEECLKRGIKLNLNLSNL